MAVLAIIAAPAIVQAQQPLQPYAANVREIHQFTPSTPRAGLFQAADGYFYGTAATGGAYGFGFVYRISTIGAVETVFSFDGAGTFGATPQAALIIGADGNFYGTASAGGAYGLGAIFRLTPAGDATLLHSFTAADGPAPVTELVQAADGNFYGTTITGGGPHYGTVYRLTPQGEFSTIHEFRIAEGVRPMAALCLGRDGMLYGTTSLGGANSGGTVFRMTTGGTFAVFYAFQQSDKSQAPLVQGPDGAFYGVTNSYAGGVFRVTVNGEYTLLAPYGDTTSAMVVGTDGALYGTTRTGGGNLQGTAFRVTTDGVATTLHSFGTSNGGGKYPNAPLVVGRDGFLYGTTIDSEVAGDGTVFRLANNGDFSLLHSFEHSTPFDPGAPLTLGGDGNFYGTSPSGGANGYGAIYRLSPDGAVTELYGFTYADTRGQSVGPLLEGPDGILYGTTSAGGANNRGTIFSFSKENGTFAILHNFAEGTSNGTGPFGRLFRGSDGSLYGLTQGGGTQQHGILFRYSTFSGIGVVYSFPATPVTIVLGKDGNFYGVSNYTGVGRNVFIYRITPDGVYSVFCEPADDLRLHPLSLIQGRDGNFYGTCGSLRESTSGAIFRVNAAGEFAELYSLSFADGDAPTNLIQASDGNFYGTTASRDTVRGTAFRLTPGGEFTKLYQVPADPLPASALTEGADGAFYGTATTAASGVRIRGAILRLDLTPVVTSAAAAGGAYGSVFNYQITATNNPASFSASGLPPGLSLDAASGVISGVPSTGGVFRVTLAAANVHGTGEEFTLTLTISQQPPVITSSLNPPARVGVAFSYQITAANGVSSYAATGLPPGLAFNAAQGKINGVPQTAGTYNPVISVSNSGGTGQATLTLTVKPQPPVISSASPVSGTTGKPFSYQIAASNSPASYGAANLPSGLSIDQQTGLISGTPQTAGSFTVTIAAFNGGGSGSAQLTLTVSLGAPAITSAASTTAVTGIPFAYQIAANGSPTKYGAAFLPSGVTIDQTTGKLSGVPTTAGTYAVTIAAFNRVGSGQAKLTITVGLGAPTITSASAAAGTVGKPFSYQIAATGTPTKYGAAYVPSGLSIDQTTGRITGTPKTAGTYAVTIAAFNGAGSGQAKLTLTVRSSP